MEHHRFVNSFMKKYNEYIDDTRPLKSNFAILLEKELEHPR